MELEWTLLRLPPITTAAELSSFEVLDVAIICTSKHLPNSFDSEYFNFNLLMNCMGQMNSRI